MHEQVVVGRDGTDHKRNLNYVDFDFDVDADDDPGINNKSEECGVRSEITRNSTTTIVRTLRERASAAVLSSASFQN